MSAFELPHGYATPGEAHRLYGAMAAEIRRLEREVAALRTALGHAIGTIEAHVPVDALGVDSHEGWSIRDMYLHHMRAALTPGEPLEGETADPVGGAGE